MVWSPSFPMAWVQEESKGLFLFCSKWKYFEGPLTETGESQLCSSLFSGLQQIILHLYVSPSGRVSYWCWPQI